MTGRQAQPARGIVPLLLVSAVVMLLTAGLTGGVWVGNLHNGLLAAAFTGVGGYVLVQRPGHREGRLLLATGVVEAVVFTGRQVGHAPTAGPSPWWGWFGVWPVALSIALVTVTVLRFPDGRLPSPRWRPIEGAVIGVAVVCSGLSALWPVELAATGIVTGHPFALGGLGVARSVWSALAHPAYAVFQLLWVVAVLVRWRGAGQVLRAQLTWVALAAALSAALLVGGLLVAGDPTPGLLSTALVPIAAGWAVVHGRHLAAYAALSWLSRAGHAPEDLPTHLTRAAAEALAATGATLWRGTGARLTPAGRWPGPDPAAPVPAPVSLAELHGLPGHLVRPVLRGPAVVGALGVDRADTEPLAPAEETLLADLTAQAALVLGHLALVEAAGAAARTAAPGPPDTPHLEGLTPREHDVLALMARGCSNSVICAELHLSIKTVEPVVGAIFTKLGLPADGDSNRRVLAVRAWLGH